MNDERRTKTELIADLQSLRKRVAELEQVSAATVLLTVTISESGYQRILKH